VGSAHRGASEFLTPGPGQQDVLVRRGRLAPSGDPQSAQRVEHDEIRPNGAAPSTRLVVLVDGDSASAAEIVAAALHDYHRGTLLGIKTFGKGSVQEDFQLPDGSDLHLTVERWFGPAGESIDGTGITPDRVVALPDPDHRFRLDAQGADATADPQLQAALAAAAG
jgi:C-terminal peptidase prc